MGPVSSLSLRGSYICPAPHWNWNVFVCSICSARRCHFSSVTEAHWCSCWEYWWRWQIDAQISAVYRQWNKCQHSAEWCRQINVTLWRTFAHLLMMVLGNCLFLFSSVKLCVYWLLVCLYSEYDLLINIYIYTVYVHTLFVRCLCTLSLHECE